MSDENIKLLSLVLGALGFALGVYNLWRQARATREQRSLSFAQLKADILASVTDAEVMYTSTKRRLKEVRARAVAAGLQSRCEALDAELSRIGRLSKRLAGLKEALLAVSPQTVDHGFHLLVTDEAKSTLNEASHSRLLDERLKNLLDPIERELEPSTEPRPDRP